MTVVGNDEGLKTNSEGRPPRAFPDSSQLRGTTYRRLILGIVALPIYWVYRAGKREGSRKGYRGRLPAAELVMIPWAASMSARFTAEHSWSPVLFWVLARRVAGDSVGSVGCDFVSYQRQQLAVA
jgi:hypothetical protein